MKTKILADFQMSISVPLNNFKSPSAYRMNQYEYLWSDISQTFSLLSIFCNCCHKFHISRIFCWYVQGIFWLSKKMPCRFFIRNNYFLWQFVDNFQFSNSIFLLSLFICVCRLVRFFHHFYGSMFILFSQLLYAFIKSGKGCWN